MGRVASVVAGAMAWIVPGLIGLCGLFGLLSFGAVSLGLAGWPEGVLRPYPAGRGGEMLAAAVCAIAVPVFLFPLAGVLFRRQLALPVSRSWFGARILLAGATLVACHAAVVSVFGVSEARSGVGLLALWMLYAGLSMAQARGAGRRDNGHPDDAEPREDVSGKTPEGFRIIEPAPFDDGHASTEERRRRLIAAAALASAPAHVRRGLEGPRRGRRLLAASLTVPTLLILALGVYGDRGGRFLATAEILSGVQIALPVAGALALLMGLAVAVFGDLDRVRPFRNRSRALVGMLAGAGLPILTLLFFESALTRGALTLHAQIVGGPPATARVSVVSRERGRVLLQCPHVLTVRVAADAPAQPVCMPDAAQWQGTRPGDVLYITGIATEFGLRYYSFDR